MSEYDYEELGLIAGLEIHQQLDTASKLYCNCPTVRREPEESVRSFTRYLHPTRSELGELDDAAVEESRVEREFTYLAFDSTCLVEEDDEPPHRVDHEAVTVALEVAQLLDMEALDQAQIMRKIVVDGSNTSGFQRTTLIANDGEIQTSEGAVGIEDLMLEEESAQRIEESDRAVTFGLDRLGIPLVEIGTKPDIRTPAQAREAAEQIGMLLRSTGQVKRGLGTIRQDVNVSIADGARVEMKGVQSLDGIEDLVRNEVHRQVRLLELKDELEERSANVGEVQDVTAVFEDSESGVIKGALDAGGKAMAVPLTGFDGLVGAEIQPDRRLGTEFADHAKRNGAGGIFHTDELPAYGVTEAEVDALREAVGAGADDAVAMVAAAADVAEQAIEAVAARAEVALEEVPEETRGANEDGTSQYLRPLPGAARMYPETDVPPVDLDPSEVEIPELLTAKVERYQQEFGFTEDLANQMAYSRRMPLFERGTEMGVDANTAANVVESTVIELRRDDVPVTKLTENHFAGVFALLADGDLAKEGIPELLTALAENPELDAETAAEQEGLGSAGEDEVRDIIVEVVERNESQVKEQGMGAFSALMGESMGALRGKAEGEVVSSILREEIQKRS